MAAPSSEIAAEVRRLRAWSAARRRVRWAANEFLFIRRALNRSWDELDAEVRRLRQLLSHSAEDARDMVHAALANYDEHIAAERIAYGGAEALAAPPDPKLHAETGPTFLGVPERWLDSPTWRCMRGHVSKRYLKSEEKGSLCLLCGEPVRLTYPEDADDIRGPSVIEFAQAILHGDDQHRAWLLAAADAFVAGEILPPHRPPVKTVHISGERPYATLCSPSRKWDSSLSIVDDRMAATCVECVRIAGSRP